MEEDKAVEIWIVRIEKTSLVESMVVLDKSAYSHFVADTILDN